MPSLIGQFFDVHQMTRFSSANAYTLSVVSSARNWSNCPNPRSAAAAAAAALTLVYYYFRNDIIQVAVSLRSCAELPPELSKPVRDGSTVVGLRESTRAYLFVLPQVFQNRAAFKP